MPLKLWPGCCCGAPGSSSPGVVYGDACLAPWTFPGDPPPGSLSSTLWVIPLAGGDPIELTYSGFEAAWVLDDPIFGVTWAFDCLEGIENPDGSVGAWRLIRFGATCSPLFPHMPTGSVQYEPFFYTAVFTCGGDGYVVTDVDPNP